jgi:hypothetical protein
VPENSDPLPSVSEKLTHEKVSVEEAALLRVISDALDCPMPPLVGKPV